MGGLKKLLVQDEVNAQRMPDGESLRTAGAELILRTELKALREDMEVFYSVRCGHRRRCGIEASAPYEGGGIPLQAEKASLIEAIIQMVGMDAGKRERAAASVGGL